MGQRVWFFFSVGLHRISNSCLSIGIGTSANATAADDDTCRHKLSLLAAFFSWLVPSDRARLQSVLADVNRRLLSSEHYSLKPVHVAQVSLVCFSLSLSLFL